MDAATDAGIQRAVAVLTAAGAREVYLFGSVARGTMRDDSDVDIAVVGLPPQWYYRAVAELGDVFGRPVDLIDLDESNAFTRYLKSEGELRRVG